MIENTLDHMLEDFDDGPSNFKMDIFITTLSGDGHPYGMYQQALRELSSRCDLIKEQFSEIDRQIQNDCITKSTRRLLREFTRFFNQASYLKNLAEDYGETDYWLHKFKCTAALEIRCTGHIGMTLASHIAILPKKLKIQLMNHLQDPKTLVNWFENYCPPKACAINSEDIEHKDILDAIKYPSSHILKSNIA